MTRDEPALPPRYSARVEPNQTCSNRNKIWSTKYRLSQGPNPSSPHWKKKYKKTPSVPQGLGSTSLVESQPLAVQRGRHSRHSRRGLVASCIHSIIVTESDLGSAERFGRRGLLLLQGALRCPGPMQTLVPRGLIPLYPCSTLLPSPDRNGAVTSACPSIAPRSMP